MEYRKIYIENFGKIKSAEVEIAPFMLLLVIITAERVI